MDYKQYRYMVILLVFGFLIGCSAKADHDATAQLSSQFSEPTNSSKRRPPNEVSVRFVVEPAGTPQPGAVGNIVDKDHAWVIGLEGGELLRTVDGGKTWQQLRLKAEDQAIFGKMRDMYVRTYFVTTTRGWMMANSGTWQTEDGGLTWRLLFTKLFDDIRFPDQQHGWMNTGDSKLGQQSYVTEDGGQTWSPCGPKRSYLHNVPGQESYFLTSRIGWSVTSRDDKRDPRISTKGVARTSDGGCTWEQLWVADDPDDRYFDIYFIDENEGWLAGENMLFKKLLHTTDGGRSWSEISRPTVDSNVLHVYFADKKEGWIISGYTLMPADGTGVYMTSNAGSSWRELSEREIVKGFDENGRHFEVPEKWQAGKLLQLLYSTSNQIH